MQMSCKCDANEAQLLMQMSILSLESTAGWLFTYLSAVLTVNLLEAWDSSCFGGDVNVL